MLGALLLTSVSAALYSAAFPPLAIGPLAWFALAPWLVALARVRTTRAAVLGLLWGIAIGLGTGASLVDMVSVYMGQPRWVGWASLIAVSAILAGVECAAFSVWVSWLVNRRLASPILVGASFAVCELARARLLVGNPWALLATSQVGSSAIVQIAALVGPHGVGFLLASVNAAIAALVAPGLRGPHHVREGALIALATLAALLYGHHALRVPIEEPSPVRVAVVQGAIQRDLAWRPEYRRTGLARYVELSRQTSSFRPELLVWPENAVSFYLQEKSGERDSIVDLARDLGVTIVLGGPHYSPARDRARYHNSVFALTDGLIRARYDKQRLVPFAEENTLGLMTTKGARYSLAEKSAPLDAANTRIGAFICFEAMYPELVRSLTKQGAQLLINLSNDAWFGSQAAARHHLQHAILRAIETRRFLVRATSTGYSAIVDPMGRVVALSGFDAPDVLLGSVQPRDELTPYVRFGEWPVAVLFGLALVVRVVVPLLSRPNRPIERTGSQEIPVATFDASDGTATRTLAAVARHVAIALRSSDD